MNQLFSARNILRASSSEKFDEYLEKNNKKLGNVDYINLLQQAYNQYNRETKTWLNYVRIFHKHNPSVIFEFHIIDNSSKLSILDQLLSNRRREDLQQLINIDYGIVKQFCLESINCVIDNAVKNKKQQKNCMEMISIILNKQPSIICNPIHNRKQNPLIQSLINQLYLITLILLQKKCYILPAKNYDSNEFHYLFKHMNVGKSLKKNYNIIMDIIRCLLNSKVDLYQKNENGRAAFELCPNQFKDDTEKLSKSLPSSRNYHKSHTPHNHHSTSGTNKHTSEKYREPKQKSSKQEKHGQHESSTYRDRDCEYEDDKNPVKTHENLSESVHNSSNTNISVKSAYKSANRVKSEFGGKDIIKQNNELLRINIQSNLTPGLHNNNNNSAVKITFNQLQSQADSVFQKYTNKKQELLKLEKQQFQREEKAFKDSASKIIQSEELKYYLKQEIKLLCYKITQQNQAKKSKYQQLYQKIKENLEQFLPIEVGLFGSFATDLHLEESDIDLVIIPRPTCPHQPSYLFEHANHILAQMSGVIQYTNYLDKASVPIIKASSTLQYSFKNIDISFMDKLHNGLHSVPLIREYLVIYPELRNLILVLKKFIYESKMFAPYSGGLSSYGLVLMIVGFIQNQYAANGSVNNANYDVDLRVAQLLIGFLKFYGFKMDYVTQKIIVARPEEISSEYFKKCTVYNPEWQNEYPIGPRLNITDPLLADNNVGKPTRRIKQIKMAFELAYIAIHTNKRCKGKKTCESYQCVKKAVVGETRFKQNKRPCCVLKRMFQATQNFEMILSSLSNP